MYEVTVTEEIKERLGEIIKYDILYLHKFDVTGIVTVGGRQ